MATCTFPRGAARPSNDVIRNNLRAALHGDTERLWLRLSSEAEAQAAAAPPASPPPSPSEDDGDLELLPGSIESSKLVGRLLHTINGGHLAKAWAGCDRGVSAFADVGSDSVAAKLAALHPQTQLPPALPPPDEDPFETPDDIIRDAFRSLPKLRAAGCRCQL